MTKRAPYMPLYGKDAWNDEKFAALPWDVQGLFWRLAYWQWTEGSIPADAEVVISIIGKPRETKRMWPRILEFFVPLPGDPTRLVNGHMEELRSGMLERKARLSDGAASTNKGRWGTTVAQIGKSDLSLGDKEAIAKCVASRVATANAVREEEGSGEKKHDPRNKFGQKDGRELLRERGLLHKVR